MSAGLQFLYGDVALPVKWLTARLDKATDPVTEFTQVAWLSDHIYAFASFY
jgi:hypothetical protein